MRCRANHNSHSNLPLNSPTRISSPTGTHNTHLGFLHTLSGTAQEFHVHLLPQSCMFYRQSVNWSVLLQIFQVFLQSPPYANCIPPRYKTHSGDHLQGHPAGHIPAAAPLFCPTDRAGFALDGAHKLYRALHSRMRSSLVERVFSPLAWGFGLHVWLMIEKAKAFFSDF